jgi:hypothetical protein
MSPAKPRSFCLISCLNPLITARDKIITPRPSMIPTTAMRTISFEKVRFDWNDIRADINEAKLNAG